MRRRPAVSRRQFSKVNLGKYKSATPELRIVPGEEIVLYFLLLLILRLLQQNQLVNSVSEQECVSCRHTKSTGKQLIQLIRVCRFVKDRSPWQFRVKILAID